MDDRPAEQQARDEEVARPQRRHARSVENSSAEPADAPLQGSTRTRPPP